MAWPDATGGIVKRLHGHCAQRVSPPPIGTLKNRVQIWRFLLCCLNTYNMMSPLKTCSTYGSSFAAWPSPELVEHPDHWSSPTYHQNIAKHSQTHSQNIHQDITKTSKVDARDETAGFGRRNQRYPHPTPPPIPVQTDCYLVCSFEFLLFGFVYIESIS